MVQREEMLEVEEVGGMELLVGVEQMLVEMEKPQYKVYLQTVQVAVVAVLHLLV